jgi:Flp pilus assembly protein TadD
VNPALVYSALQHGRLGEAERHAQALVQASPLDPEAHRAHAAVMQSAGRIDLAIQSMRAAVDLAPQAPELRLALGQVLGSAGRMEEAVEAFRAATALRPDLVDAWYLLGMTLYGLRRDADALEPMRRAHALTPQHPQIQRALAETEYAVENHAEALALYDRLAAASRGGDATLALRRSQCHRRLGLAQAADAIVREALQRFPGEATLWLELGWVQEDLGDAAQAQQAYERAHALQPAWGDPIGATIALARAAAPAGIVGKVEAMAADAAVPEPQRAYLHHVLGKRRDAQGEYADAARHWTEANRLRRGQDGDFERDAYVATIDATIAAFDAATLAALRANALRDERPLFVLGMPRSGTTLAEQILAAHPQGHGCGELTEIVSIATGIPAQTGLRWPQDAARLAPAWLHVRAQAWLARAARGASADARRLVDKQPYNFLHVGLIAMLFADARIVWCRRDPRDIALSIYSESFAPSATYATDLDDIAFVIAQQERLMRHWQAVSPLPILEFQYEAVVADAEAQMRRLIDFAGLSWDERCLRFHESGRTVQTLSRWQVRQPVHPRSVGRWRHYPQWFAEA